jgi:hypothetical protein
MTTDLRILTIFDAHLLIHNQSYDLNNKLSRRALQCPFQRQRSKNPAT